MTKYTVSDMDALATLSNNRTEKHVEAQYEMRYTTAKSWNAIDIDHAAEGYRKFIIEFLKRINIEKALEVNSSLTGAQPSSNADLATVIRMPTKVIEEHEKAKIEWKREIVAFLKQFDRRLLQKQYDMIKHILAHQQIGGGVDKEGLPKIFGTKNKPRKRKATDASNQDE